MINNNFKELKTAARTKGLKTFVWQGKTYDTILPGESIEEWLLQLKQSEQSEQLGVVDISNISNISNTNNTNNTSNSNIVVKKRKRKIKSQSFK